MADFEKGIWQGLRAVFPQVAMHGCAFHWAQAVYRKAQELGLGAAYKAGGGVNRLVRRILALPFLPAEHIPPAHRKLSEKTTDPRLLNLLQYVDSAWLRSSVWEVSSWSSFMRATRTNNDVEGWHRRVNARAGRSCLHFYALLRLLHQEAKLVPMRVSLVSEGKLRRQQKKSTRQIQGKLFALWLEYREERLTASQLLKGCSRVYCPV